MRDSLIGCLLGLVVFHCASTAAENPPALDQAQLELIRQALWGSPEQKKLAYPQLQSIRSTPTRVKQVEQIIRAGRPYQPVKASRQTVVVPLDAKRNLTVQVQLPPSYAPTKRYPLMIAIGGGPPPNEKRARSSGRFMLAVWSKAARDAGWIVAAIEDTVSVRMPGKKLRYHILHADHMRRVLNALMQRFAVDPGGVHVTGISLGSNYAIAYAAAHPDWIAGIAPVSTEGESREHVVRNLQHVSVLVLEGAKDKNIRTIEGPRKQAKILEKLNYRHRYEEDAKQGHVGFVAKYPEVLQWLARHKRPAFPKSIIRLPHRGIIMPAKRFYWLEADSHQAAFAAQVTGNRIDANVARAGRLTFHLSARLLNLDAPVIIRINGKVVHDQPVQTSLQVALADAVALHDSERFATARLSFDVPSLEAGENWLKSLDPEIQPSQLPYWEHYAITTLQEECPKLPAELEPVTSAKVLPANRTGLRVTKIDEGSPLREGDLILQFDGEPFYAGTNASQFLKEYLMRTNGKSLALRVSRQGKTLEVQVPLAR